MHDDRAEFAAERTTSALAIGADAELNRRATELFAAADEHRYSYVWSWLGVPIIQVPADIVAMQEIIWDTRPQLVVETGVARGGSLIFHASMLQLLGEGEVLGIDIDIRPHNRESIESHPLAHRIRLLEGSSTDAAILDDVSARCRDVERVMVVLDSNHTHDHVLAELNAYADLVTVGQYLVVADTIVEALPVQSHRPRPWGPGDNPATAVREFLGGRSDFVVAEELNAKLLVTSSPGGYLRRVG